MKNKRRIWITCIAMALLTLVWMEKGMAQDESAQSIPVWFGTEISIAPDPEGAGLWKCRATLEDLSSGEVLSAPEIVFAAGEEAGVQSGLSSEMVWELRVEVAADTSEAKWSSSVTMGDQVLSASAGTLRLQAE